MSLANDIRGALVTALKAVSGIPAVADETVPYSPVTGTPFVEYQVIHSTNRISTMGSDHLYRHSGMMMITAVYPSDPRSYGIGAAEAMVDTIRAAFNPSTPLTQGTNSVRIMYAERLPHVVDADWIRIPIAVEWYLYTETP